MKKSISCGLSLLELLTVLAIISLLLQMILPAIQSSRESARQTQCQSNVRQLALGCLIHVNVHKHFPTGGWNSAWIGDPNRGFNKKQPGGWGYNILPYIEQQELHEIGLGVSEAERQKQAARLYGAVVPLFTCTTRRVAKAEPYVLLRDMRNVDGPELQRLNQAARSDYAGNIGKVAMMREFFRGPSSYEEGDLWVKGTDPKKSWTASENCGIIYQRSEIKPAMVTDGLSRTFLLGEKFIPEYYQGRSEKPCYCDDQSVYVGFSYDNNRAGDKSTPPIADHMVQVRTTSHTTMLRFGSAHPTGFNMACGDGSVHRVDYEIDELVFAAMCTRNVDEPSNLE